MTNRTFGITARLIYNKSRALLYQINDKGNPIDKTTFKLVMNM